eukprot:4303575-Amphidinium_carterae.2
MEVTVSRNIRSNDNVLGDKKLGLVRVGSMLRKAVDNGKVLDLGVQEEGVPKPHTCTNSEVSVGSWRLSAAVQIQPLATALRPH